MEALQQRLRSARADLLKAREDMKALDVLSAISQEQLKLSLEEYQAAYNELLKRDSAGRRELAGGHERGATWL